MHPVEAMPAWFQGLVWPSFSVMDRPTSQSGTRRPGEDYRERHYRPDLTPLPANHKLTKQFFQMTQAHHPIPFQPLSAIAVFKEHNSEMFAIEDIDGKFDPFNTPFSVDEAEYRCFVNWQAEGDDGVDDKFLSFRRFTDIIREIQFTIEAQLLQDTAGRVRLTAWQFSRLITKDYFDKDNIKRHDTTSSTEIHTVPMSYFERIRFDRGPEDRLERRRYVKQFMRPFQVGTRT